MVENAQAGERVDRACAEHWPELSRGDVQRAAESSLLTVNGASVKLSYRVREGDVVVMRLAAAAPSNALAEEIALDIVFEDLDVLVVNKPAGLVVHPAKGHWHGTLVNAVLFHTELAPDPDAPLRPGIVHRLDRDTSGLMVIAKSTAARESLREQFRAHSVERRYEAIAHGVVAKQTFDSLHGRHPTDRKLFSSRVTEGKRAVTHVAPQETFGTLATHLECRLDTGRTHQIRVHLSDAGHGLLGDQQYGSANKNPRINEIAKTLNRQALHARVLGFVHPRTGGVVRFETAPPADFALAILALRDLALR